MTDQVSPCRPQSKKKFHYDPTVSLGNILTALALVVAVIVFAMRLEGKVDINTTRLDGLEKRIDREYSEIKSALNRIDDRLAVKLKEDGQFHHEHSDEGGR